MMYLTPKGDETLKKWGQQCLTTFLDAFLRIAILYFIILIIGVIRDAGLFDGGLSKGIVIMLGLFMFVKKAPELIGELFPSMGGKASLGFGIKSPKQAWNDLKSTPVAGLGAAAIGYGVNKGYRAYKTKHDDIKKAKVQARRDLKNDNKLDKLGSDLHKKYGDNLPDTAFASNDYRKSYNAVVSAKNEVKKTEAVLENAQAEFTAAYNSTGPNREARIAAARANYDNAKKQDKAAQTRLEMAKKHHDNQKRIHAKDARIEDAYKHYGDLHPTSTVVPQNTSLETDSSSSSVVTEEHVPSRPRTQESRSSQDDIASQHANLVSQYEQETDPARKAQLRQQIDDFERKH